MQQNDHLLTSTPYDGAMLDACFSHLYFYQSLHILQRGLAAIADLLVILSINNSSNHKDSLEIPEWIVRTVGQLNCSIY